MIFIAQTALYLLALAGIVACSLGAIYFAGGAITYVIAVANGGDVAVQAYLDRLALPEYAELRERVEQSVLSGGAKLQWKVDWAMRWVALGVDYEMAGKDLIDSVKLSGEITKALGGLPPEGFNYELFLDEKGQKISKSKGNGLTIDEWLRYAPPESLAYYIYQKPKTAKPKGTKTA